MNPLSVRSSGPKPFTSSANQSAGDAGFGEWGRTGFTRGPIPSLTNTGSGRVPTHTFFRVQTLERLIGISIPVRSSVCDWHGGTSQHLSPWPELRYLPRRGRHYGA